MGYSVTIGRCSGASSPVHRVDARAKAVCFIVLSMLSFLIDDAATAIFMGMLALVLVCCARIPLGTFWRTIRPFVILLAFSFLINVLVVQGGLVLAAWGPLRISARGVETGVLVACRTLAALAFGVLLVGTTTPVDLCDALESLLKPLRVFGLPYQDVAMVLSIALRYIPLLAEEAQQVVNAQKSRGAIALSGSVRKRAKMYASLAVPLLSSSIRHSERLAAALEARCWAAEDVRTHLTKHSFRLPDAFFLLCMAAAIVAFCLLVFLAG